MRHASERRIFVERQQSVVTPERFASGMTFDQYVQYIGTPANLTREAGWWLGRGGWTSVVFSARGTR
jgi:hypothetical protein